MRVPEPQIMIVTLGFGNKIVVIGPSKSASWKRKTIPGAGGELTCPTAVAKTTSAHRRAWIGGATYSDTFSVSVSGRSVTVRRTDITQGWGMNLKIACKYGRSFLLAISLEPRTHQILPDDPMFLLSSHLFILPAFVNIIAIATTYTGISPAKCDISVSKSVNQKGIDGCYADRGILVSGARSYVNQKGKLLYWESKNGGQWIIGDKVGTAYRAFARGAGEPGPTALLSKSWSTYTGNSKVGWVKESLKIVAGGRSSCHIYCKNPSALRPL